LVSSIPKDYGNISIDGAIDSFCSAWAGNFGLCDLPGYTKSLSTQNYIYQKERQIAIHPKYDSESQVDLYDNHWVVESHYLKIQGLLKVMRNIN
jgi:hypothetical protein